MPPGAALGPGHTPVLEHDGSSGRVHRAHGRLNDRLERLLEVERLRHCLRDPRERLELGNPALGMVVELRVLDRLRHLTCDRHEQVDLRLVVLPRGDRPHVERPLETILGEDRDGEDRFVLLLVQIREVLEARIEMGSARDHDRRTLGRCSPGDSLARTELRGPGQLLRA